MKWRKSIFSHSFALESPRVRPCPHEAEILNEQDATERTLRRRDCGSD